jgi:AcrR family transcriptional regulator
MDADRIAELRERAIEAAMTMVAELGEEGLTVRGLARTLGISTTAMYQLFENKHAIMRALRFRGIEYLDEALRPAFELDDPLDRIADMSRRYVEFARARPWLYRMLFQSEPLDPESISEDEAQQLRTSQFALEKALRDGIERGRLRPDLDIALTPLRLWAKNHGLVLLVLAGKLGPRHPLLGVDDTSEFIDRFVAHTTRALRPRESVPC